MNRRNFVLGLGTAATLSGAASVTGASLASTTDVSNTDFRVFAQAALEANGTFTGDDGYDDHVKFFAIFHQSIFCTLSIPPLRVVSG